MTDDDNGAPAHSSAKAKAKTRKCFVVSAFGKTPEDQRAHSQVLKHLVRKVLAPRGYKVERADEIAEEGLITNQIIEHLLDDDLVVADLTGLNPNVFYEIAVRHAARKPIVHLITQGDAIPFDVANMRTVQYALDDPDVLEAAQVDFEKKVEAIEASDFKAFPNPITSVRDVAILRESESPEARDTGVVLTALNELRADIQVIQRRVGMEPERQLREETVRPSHQAIESILRGWLRASDGPIRPRQVAMQLDVSPSLVRECLIRMERKGEIERTETGYKLKA